MQKQQVTTTEKIGAVLFFAALIAIVLLLPGCGIKWATNRVLANPDAIAKVGAVYDALTPKDTTERLVFIPGDSVVIERLDTAYLYKNDTISKKDTILITKTVKVNRVDTIRIKLPPDNRALARMADTAAHYKRLFAETSGKASGLQSGLKTAEKRLIWMAAILLLAGVVIGVLVKFKFKI